jgi:Zn-dependent M28 family amino/carboxypeptidase
MTMLAEDLRDHVQQLCAGPRHRAIDGSRERARDYVETVLRRSGWSITRLDYRSRASVLRTSDYGRPWWPAGAGGPIEGRNVIAHRGDPTGAIWLMAHLDTVHSSPGADDDASAVSIALEVGRRVNRDDLAIVLTDNEESAMLGARFLVRRGPRPQLVINLESLGYYQDAVASQRMIPDIALGHRRVAEEIRRDGSRGNFVLLAYRPNSSAAASRVCSHLQRAGISVRSIEDRRWNGAGQKITARLNPVGLSFDRSDHAPFWRAQIPAIVLSDTAPARNPHYHRPTDTPDTLDYDRMAVIVHGLVNSLRDHQG